MSKGGGTTTTSSIDPKVLGMLQGNYSRAQGVANQPYTPYTGTLQTPASASTQNAGTAIANAGNAGSGALNSAISGTQSAANYNPTAVTAAQSDAPTQFGTDIASIMNPYTKSVVNSTLSDLDRSRQMAVNQNASNATASDAFGGDRQAVTDALTNEAYSRTAANTLADLNMRGWDSATGLWQNQQALNQNNRQFNAGQQNYVALANQDLGLRGAAQRMAANQQLGALGGQQFNQATETAQNLFGLGKYQDALAQANLDKQYQEFLREQSDPYMRQDLLNKSLGLFGSASGTQQTTAQQSSNPLGSLGQLFGGLAMMAAI